VPKLFHAPLAALALLFCIASVVPARAEPAPPPPSPAGVKPDAAAVATAKERYESSCATCHGADGAGNGLAAAGLPVRPRSFTDPAWQQKTSDAEIDRAIVGGGAAVGRSPLMAPNPDLEAKPAVVAALRAMIRGFGAAGQGAALKPAH
jgi:high-affinity iron transporter